MKEQHGNKKVFVTGNGFILYILLDYQLTGEIVTQDLPANRWMTSPNSLLTLRQSTKISIST